MHRIPQDRALSTEEYALTRWLLEHGAPGASRHLPELDVARVAGRCPCGCASVHFAVAGADPARTAGLAILADYLWRDATGKEAGVFVYAYDERLAGLEVYTLHPDAAIDRLPPPEALVPMEQPP